MACRSRRLIFWVFSATLFGSAAWVHRAKLTRAAAKVPPLDSEPTTERQIRMPSPKSPPTRFGAWTPRSQPLRVANWLPENPGEARMDAFLRNLQFSCDDSGYRSDVLLDLYLQGLTQRLLQGIGPYNSSAGGPKFRSIQPFWLADRSVNAMAMGGSLFYLHTQTALKAEREGELAVVVAHELSHLVLGHLQNSFIDPKAPTLEKAGIQRSASLGSVGRMRECEWQADTCGIKLALLSGFPEKDLRQGLANLEDETLYALKGRFLQQTFLSDEQSPEAFLERQLQKQYCDHAPTAQRIGNFAHVLQNFSNLVPESHPKQTPVQELDFQLAKARIRCLWDTKLEIEAPKGLLDSSDLNREKLLAGFQSLARAPDPEPQTSGYYGLALSYLLLEEPSKAQACLDQIPSIYRNHAWVRLLESEIKGELSVNAQKEVKEGALEELKMAMQKFGYPERAENRILGHLLLKGGDRSAALPYLVKALRLKNGEADPSLAEELALAYSGNRQLLLAEVWKLRRQSLQMLFPNQQSALLSALKQLRLRAKTPEEQAALASAERSILQPFTITSLTS